MTATTPRGPGEAGAKTQDQPPLKVKYLLYARKSTESEERQVLSIDSQVKEMLQIAEREKLEIAEIRRESHSAKDSGQRPVFNEILIDIKRGLFNGIMTWAPDRLSRNAGDLGSLVDLMDQKLLLDIRTYGQRFSNSPNEKFLLMILCSQAKLENDNRGINVKRGLRTRVEMGLWPGLAPTGYLNEKRMDKKCHILVDPDRAPIIKKMFEKAGNEHWSGRKIYHWLRFELNFTTRGNHHLSLSNVYKILTQPFYYGMFEYPKKSGNWYTGKHEPIVSKDLFDKVQEQLTRDYIRRESKEFAFTKLIKCGYCGSGITADEKYKKLKNGTVAKYVYYGCTRARDLSCKGGYIREEEMINQLVKVIDKIDVNELGIKKKFEEEMDRYRKLRRTVLGLKAAEEEIDAINLRTYARHLLNEGAIQEKRELLSNLRTLLTLKNKQIVLEEAK